MKAFLPILLLISSPSWAATEILVHVKGMVCAFCAQGIEKKFSAEAAVESVKVSLEKHLVKLGLKDSKGLDDSRIADLLKESGYTVEKIER